MENCLVTKLKSVVDNDNLDYLNYVVFKGTLANNFTDGGIFAVRNSEHVSEIRLLNTDGATLTYSAPYFSLTKGSGNIVSILFPRYIIDNIEFSSSKIYWDYEKISTIFGITTFETKQGTSFQFQLSDISFQNVQALSLSASGAVGDIAEIAKMPTITTLSLAYNRFLTGDLSSIKDMPNLTSVSLDHTYVTDINDAVTYMRNRGITVTYIPYDS
jgi:hypothetical protein